MAAPGPSNPHSPHGGRGGGGGGDGGSGPSCGPPPPPASPHHVAAVDQGLHLEPETLSYWGYDDGTSTLLVVKGGLVFAYDVSPGLVPGSPEQLRWTWPLADGPGVRSARLSLDGGLLALQRSDVLIEFVELASGNVFVQGTDRGRGEILAFFFTELAGADVVLVTPGGLEMLEFVPRRQGLRLRERVRLPVEWALYTHETRMVLLGTPLGGMQVIKAFQFVSGGLVALPPFTAGAAASALTLMGAAGAAGVALVAGSPAAAAAIATPPDRVTVDCLRLLKVYGRVYCAHINRRALKLELYRFYTDTVVLQHTYELFHKDVDLAVVDGLLVVVAAATHRQPPPPSPPTHTTTTSHHPDQLLGLALLYDVAVPTSHPLANPLPLKVVRNQPGPLEAELDEPLAAAAAAAGGCLTAEAGPGSRRSGGGQKADVEGSRGSGRWEYLAPNVLLDRFGQTVFRLALNLQDLVETCSDAAVLVGVLQRRRGALAAPVAAAAAVAQSPKALLMAVVRNALQERLPLPTVRAMFEDLCAGNAAALDRQLAAAAVAAVEQHAKQHTQWAAGGATSSAAAASPAPPPVAAAAAAAAVAAAAVASGGVLMPHYLSADELSSELFRWLHDEEVVDAPYLQAALCEYMAAAAAAGIPLPPCLQGMWVELLLQQSQEAQLAQLLYGQAPHISPEVMQSLLPPQPPPKKSTSATTATSNTPGGAAAAASTSATTHGDITPAAPASSLGAAGAVGGAGAAGGVGAFPAAPLTPQVGIDTLARNALSARYEPVISAAATGSSRATGAGPGGGDAAEYVGALLARGQVLRAARVLRRYRVTAPGVKEFLAAVAAGGDEAALAAVYRTFQGELLASYPKYDLAARKLLPAVSA